MRLESNIFNKKKTKKKTYKEPKLWNVLVNLDLDVPSYAKKQATEILREKKEHIREDFSSGRAITLQYPAIFDILLSF